MKTQKLKYLFADAKSANDIIEIFNANPNLEDEILELGKKQRIDPNESKELSELELELVAGGLSLKAGVVTTMATLMVASSIIGPLGTVQKANAAENPQVAGIEQDADDVNLESALDGINLGSSLDNVNLESMQKQSKSTSSQTTDTEEVQKLISESEAELSKQTENAKKNANSKTEIGSHAEKSNYEGTNYNPEMENETTSNSDGSIIENAIKEGLDGGFKAVCDAIPIPILSSVIGEAGAAFFDSLFGLKDTKNEDAATRNKIRENTSLIINNSNNGTQAVIQNTNNKAFELMNFMKEGTDQTNALIKDINYSQALTAFETYLAGIDDTITQASLSQAFDIIYSGDQDTYLNERHWIDPAFEEAYNATNASSKYLFYAFKSVSNIIIGNSIESQNVNFMDLEKMHLNANTQNEYVFDSDSIEKRKEYLTKVAKTYLSQYVQVYNIINYEYKRSTQRYIEDYIERDAEVQRIPKEEYANMTFKQFESKFYRGNTKDEHGKTIEGIDAKYHNRIVDSEKNLNELKILYNNALKQIKIEFAKLDFESSQNCKDYFVIDNVAYKLDNIINSENYNFSLFNDSSNKTVLATDSLKDIIGDEDFDKINKIYNTDRNQETESRAFDAKKRVEVCENKLRDIAKNIVAKSNTTINNETSKDGNKIAESNEEGITEKADNIDAYILKRLIAKYNDTNAKNISSKKIDGIFTHEDSLSYSELNTFHREFYYKWWHFFSRSYGVDAIRGFKISKQLHYISENSDVNGKTIEISRSYDFKDGTNTAVSSESSKNLGVFKITTKEYCDKLIDKVEHDTGINIKDEIYAKYNINV